MYFDEDAEYVDALTIAPFNQIAKSMRVWSQRVSDSQACIDVFAPVQAKPHVALTDQRCPVLCICWELHRLGWHPINSKVVHESVDDMRFDSRGVESKRSYLQCVLTLGPTLAKNPAIPSDEPQSYYQVLLQGMVVAARLGDKHYKALLRNDVPSDGDAAALEDGEESTKAMGIEDDSDDVELCGGGEVAPVADIIDAGAPPTPLVGPAGPSGCPTPPGSPAVDPVGAIAPVLSPSSSSNSDSSCSDAASSDIEVVAGSGEHLPGWHETPTGFKIMLDQYTPKGKARYRRWVGSCSTHGPTCQKKRSLAQNLNYGVLEPIAYLLSWDDAGSTMTLDEHCKRGWKANPDRVAAWVKRLGPAYVDQVSHIIRD